MYLQYTLSIGHVLTMPDTNAHQDHNITFSPCLTAISGTAASWPRLTWCSSVCRGNGTHQGDCEICATGGDLWSAYGNCECQAVSPNRASGGPRYKQGRMPTHCERVKQMWQKKNTDLQLHVTYWAHSGQRSIRATDNTLQYHTGIVLRLHQRLTDHHNSPF